MISVLNTQPQTFYNTIVEAKTPFEANRKNAISSIINNHSTLDETNIKVNNIETLARFGLLNIFELLWVGVSQQVASGIVSVS